MLRVSTRVVIDITSNQVIERDSFVYSGPWSFLKGGNSQAETTKANTISDQQMALMQQQLQMQAKQLAMVNPQLQALLSNQGMLPQTQAAMTTQATQGLGQQYQALQGQLSQQLQARGMTGGSMAGGGGIAQGFGQLASWEAGQQSELLNQIQLAKSQGLQNAIGMGLGEGSMFGSQALGFGQQGVGALGSGVTAAGNADQAQTGFFGSLIGGLAGLGGSVATAACPAAGSMILMADGNEKPVERLVPGEQVMGIDGDPCTIEDIPSELTKAICVTFDDGHVTSNSPTHAFALPKGGFTVSAKSQGKRVATDKGTSVVVCVQFTGIRQVFNILTDGSHTYRADGVWALGVGDAERHIPMNTWSKIGEKLIGEARAEG